jgi:ABC-type Fe3+/spermidine/putrescine transport system ATPase subunit
MDAPVTAGTDPDGRAPPTGKEKLQLRSLAKTYGSVTAVDGLSLTLQEGQLLALLGPSGCGKTTTLRMVAGLERPTGGQIVVDGIVLADASMSIEPEKRELGMVFQSYALWPHMTVFENVAYGLRRAGHARADVAQRVKEVLQIVGLPDYESRPATNLSGGQQQRVAVARALATRPRILLFDEPLSNLDAVLRESMRFEIRSLQQRQGITAIYVTHSQEEALAIADVVGVMNGGRLQQLGPPEELYDRPRTRFVASFVGLANTLSAVVEAFDRSHVAVAFASGARCAVGRPATLSDAELAAGRTVFLAVRPENIRLSGAGSVPATGDATAVTVPGTVVTTIYSGNLIDYFVDTGGFAGRVRVQSMPPVAARPGDAVLLSIASRHCILLEE